MSHNKRNNAIAGLICLLAATGSTSQAANQFHVGLLAHDVPELWSGFNRESGVDLNLEWNPDWPARQLGEANLGSHLGVTLNSEGDTSYLYGGVNLRFGQERGWYGRVGLGVALHDGETSLVSNDRKALGNRLLFHIPLELGYQWQRHSLSLYFSHVSNASLKDSNEGLDTLGLRIGWRY